MTSFNPFEFDYEDVDRNDFAEKGKQYMKEMATCIENYSDGIVAAEYGASIMNSWEDVNQFLQANTDIDATKLLHIAAFNIENRLYKFKRTNNRMNKAKTKRSHSTKFECTMCNRWNYIESYKKFLGEIKDKGIPERCWRISWLDQFFYQGYFLNVHVLRKKTVCNSSWCLIIITVITFMG